MRFDEVAEGLVNAIFNAILFFEIFGPPSFCASQLYQFGSKAPLLVRGECRFHDSSRTTPCSRNALQVFKADGLSDPVKEGIPG